MFQRGTNMFYRELEVSAGRIEFFNTTCKPERIYIPENKAPSDDTDHNSGDRAQLIKFNHSRRRIEFLIPVCYNTVLNVFYCLRLICL